MQDDAQRHGPEQEYGRVHHKPDTVLETGEAHMRHFQYVRFEECRTNDSKYWYGGDDGEPECSGQGHGTFLGLQGGSKQHEFQHSQQVCPASAAQQADEDNARAPAFRPGAGVP